jgi:tellurite methyltransferase
VTGGPYDEGYRQCSCFWGREPGRLVRLFVDRIGDVRGLRVLDVGCGEGKNARHLAGLGATVEAFDTSELALANARKAWRESPNLRFFVGDVRDLDLKPSTYDLVIAYGVLHCLRNEGEVEECIAKLQSTTTSSGHNIVCAYNDRSQNIALPHPGFQPVLLAHARYVAAYSGWRIVEASDEDLHEAHPHNNVAHTHSITRLLASKQR